MSPRTIGRRPACLQITGDAVTATRRALGYATPEPFPLRAVVVVTEPGTYVIRRWSRAEWEIEQDPPSNAWDVAGFGVMAIDPASHAPRPADPSPVVGPRLFDAEGL
jgi:hypothetical protein